MVFGFGQIGWFLLIGIFMLISWIARSHLASSPDPSKQYLGYGLYILIEAVVFLPLIYIANSVAPGIVPQAATMTGALFLGLTAVAFGSKMRFNFLGPVLGVASLVLLGVMITGMLFGFSLGLWFSAIMIAFAGGAILYDTDRVLNEYDERDHVAASLELFASVAMLLWYVIRILLQLRGRD
jgi:FtsH-binding integral membrane protein